MAAQTAPPATVAGTLQDNWGVRRVQATADLRCRPELAAGHRLLRVEEAVLFCRAPAAKAGQLRARFLLEFRYDAVRPDGSLDHTRYQVPLLLTADLPPDWTGPLTVERVRSRVTGAAVAPDRSELLAGVQMSVRFG